MNPVQPNKLVNLKQASQLLGVSIETLLSWNQNNILKPTITPEGEIGYTEHQLLQFLSIRQIIQKPIQQPSLPQVQPDSVGPTVTEPNDIFIPQMRLSPSPVGDWSKSASESHHGRKSHSSRVGISLAVLLAITTVAVLPQLVLPLPDQSQLKLAETNNKVLSSQTSSFNVAEQILSVLPIRLQNEIAHKKSLDSESDSIAKQKIIAPQLYSTNQVQNTPASSSPQKALALKSQKQLASGSANVDMSATGTADFASVGNFDSCLNCEEDKDAAIDLKGNIKGEATKADTLAMLIGGIDNIAKTGSLTPSATDDTLQFILLSLGVLAMIFVVQQQFAFPTRKSSAAHLSPHKHPETIPQKRILEIGQKTDGTVVLLFQGKEYKISKPEMNSESDQFIERLMTLTQPDLKEIEYDTMHADKVYLTTPLSRLVTRLGFVGIKRDLFFPRTSKNSVLFRKYLTRDDLAAMNLTTEQITDELARA